MCMFATVHAIWYHDSVLTAQPYFVFLTVNRISLPDPNVEDNSQHSSSPVNVTVATEESEICSDESDPAKVSFTQLVWYALMSTKVNQHLCILIA